MKKYALPFSLLSTGLLAGAFFYGTGNVIPALYDVPIKVHLMYRVPLMNHNAIYMQLLTVIGILTPVWLAAVSLNKRSKSFALCGAAAALISILITRIMTVPINHMMRVWNMTVPPDNWRAILHQWDIANYIRTGFAILSFLMIILCAQVRQRAENKESVGG